MLALPVLGSIHSTLVSTSCWQYWQDTLNQSWVTAGLLSVTLAHYQRGAKHDTLTQYWANVGSASWTVGQNQPGIALSQRLAFDRLQ